MVEWRAPRMRQPRLKAPEVFPVGFYHCISRVVDRRFVLHAAEKEQFVKHMREAEEFCEVQVRTYCILSNHFRILVAVPQVPELAQRPNAEAILAKLARLSGHQFVETVRQQFETLRQNKDEAGEAALLGSYHARMWDVNAFMKLLK